MKVKWIHTADVHLGFHQYGISERADDFARAFKYVCDYAISSKVDFMLIAGDLFHKRNIDGRTISQAYLALRSLKDANIPVICVEGNHERAFLNSGWSFLDFLSSAAELIHLLSPVHRGGSVLMEPWDHESKLGSFIDLGPVRVYGIKYYGTSTGKILEQITSKLQVDGNRFNIFMVHEGLEGQIPRAIGGITSYHLDLIRPHCKYLAMGHVHKRYEIDNWAFNPGSLETCSVEEADWERGFYEVTADINKGEVLEVKHISVPTRRPFYRIFLDVKYYDTPEDLEIAVIDKVRSRIPKYNENPSQPIIHITLSGSLRFSEELLALKSLQEKIYEEVNPLTVQIKNNTLPSGYSPDVPLDSTGQIDRRSLELEVFESLIQDYPAFKDRRRTWAESIQKIKDRALLNVPPEEIITLIEEALREEFSQQDNTIINKLET